MRKPPPRVPGCIHRRDVLRALGAALGTVAGQRIVTALEPSMIDEPWSAGGLAGSFARPAAGPPRGPAALIVAGSGPTPRDGGFGTYRQLAQGLAAAGIRSLRYDKRGVGESRALVTREDDLVVQHFADDVVTAARDLAARRDVSAVVLIGHSEGALLVTLAAAKLVVAGIILMAGPGRRLDAVLREQLLALPLPPGEEHFRKEAFDILDRLAKGERVPDAAPALAALFRPSVQPFLISMFAVDPAGEFARSAVPALVVQGASDIQVTRADFDALAKARPDARTLLLPDTNHVFKAAPADLSDRAAQLKSYDPDAPLVPALVPALVAFIRSAAP
ncbi:MAG: uncharacterized protein QOG83_1097 [Alphaproteobacteria bacterium]|nr:uncharacterized protein [Alphaproteobacteria bacterium]